MNYLPVEESLQVLLRKSLPLSPAQTQRIAILCIGILLAGEVHLSKIARFLIGDTKQDSRIRWIRRFLQSRYLTQALVYQPFLEEALRSYREKTWHLVIDRTTLWRGEIDLVTISLNYRKRAIPLYWQQVPFGGVAMATYVEIVQACAKLIPAHVRVIFHGDTEFGGQEMIRLMRELRWDFMLAQRGTVHYRQRQMACSKALSSLAVTRRRNCKVPAVELFTEKPLAAINIIAFYQPHHVRGSSGKRDIAYIATSLPLSAGLQRIGRRRWGTEPFYRDYKSAGWHVTLSQLKHPTRQEGLLLMLALLYLWTVCFGRWLCKTGQRSQVDIKHKRHLSLFRLGWDWLIHQLRCHQLIPTFIRLYS